MTSMVEYALQYAGRGWPVFRLSGKIPLKGSRGFKDATTDRAIISEWWTRRPNANIGLATGYELVVLDVDGPEGLAELKALVAIHGTLPRTLAARTGSGLHIYFAYPGDDIKSSARSKLHVRASGGFVVLPPSLHPNGRRYAWVDAGATVAELPQWLKEWMTNGGNSREKEAGGPTAKVLPEYLERLSSRGLAATALKAIKAAESNYSPQEFERIKSALAVIPAVSREIWLRVGMSLKELQWVRADGTDIGFDLWDDWSQTCPEKYPGVGGLEYTWNSFKREGGLKVGLGSLFALAQDHGWTGQVDLKVNTAASAGAHANVIEGQVNGHESVITVLPGGLSDPPHQIRFDLNDANFPKPTAKNARSAIQLLGIVCAHDTFHDRMTAGGQVLEQFAGEISDNTVHMLRIMVEKTYHFDPKLENLHDAVVELALQNQFDPVADYLDAVRWDGTRRVDTWLSRYLGAPDSAVTRAMGRKVLIAAVRRVYAPGTKFDQIIVLEGPEGKNKSTAILTMAGADNFSDQTILTLNDRQQQEQMEGVWLYEIADLTGISRAEVEKVKAFASRQIDRARAAYARKRTDRPRRCIFFATTNERTYLASQTGNRRFWPVACGHIDVGGLAADRDQLWAEAAELEAGGESLFLPESLWGEAAALQEARREVDPWDEILAGLEAHHCTIKDHPEEWRIGSRDVLQDVLKIPSDRQYSVTAKRLAHAMQRLKWSGPHLIKHGVNVFRGYAKPK